MIKAVELLRYFIIEGEVLSHSNAIDLNYNDTQEIKQCFFG